MFFDSEKFYKEYISYLEIVSTENLKSQTINSLCEKSVNVKILSVCAIKSVLDKNNVKTKEG